MIYYLSNCYGDEYFREVSISAKNKADYVSSLLYEHGCNWISVDAPLSMERDKALSCCVFDGIYGEKVILGPAVSHRDKLETVLAKLLSRIWIFFYLLLHIKKSDTLIVYHSYNRMLPVLLSRLLIKFNFILELEEIYSNISNEISFFKRWVELYYIQLADAYIAPTSDLSNYILDDKQLIVLEGNFNVSPQIVEKYDDGKVHLIYSGILTSQKGVGNALILSDYLSSNFEMHIIGYGSEDEINDLKSEVHKRQRNACKVHFDGVKTGRDYIEYLQKCHIGLCLQTIDEAYNSSSFPSKITTYLSNGLYVLSTKSNTIMRSRISQDIFFVDDDMEQVAKWLESIDFNKQKDVRKNVINIRNQHKKEISLLINLIDG